MKASTGQTWAYFCATGYDIRGVKDLTKEQASTLLQEAKAGNVNPPEGAVQIRKPYVKKSYTFFNANTGEIAVNDDGSKFTIQGAKDAKEYGNENGYTPVALG